ncbi:MAG: hypothetical protein K0R82_81 [Flavipsychrobacter sp.]|jgi:hypothetical protein|nr:hypothetical protein [Flavipsychrobacter sp.]
MKKYNVFQKIHRVGDKKENIREGLAAALN